MKFWDDIAKNTEFFVRQLPLRELGMQLIGSLAKTVYFLGEQVLQLPATLYAVVRQPVMHRAATDLIQIATHNAIPTFVMHVTTHFLSATVWQTVENQTFPVPVRLLVKGSVLTMMFGVDVYLFLKQQESHFLQFVVMLETTKKFPGIHTKALRSICEEDKCNMLHHAGAIAQGMVVQQSIGKSLDYAPVPAFLKQMIRLEQEGNLILRQILPQCEHHMQEYMDEHAELIWATGLMSVGLQQGIYWGAWGLSALPVHLVLCALGVDNGPRTLMTVFLATEIARQMAVWSTPLIRLLSADTAVHMHFPVPEKKTKAVRYPNLLHPLGVYTNALGLGVEGTVVVSQWLASRFLPKQTKPTNWTAVINDIKYYLHHPMLRQMLGHPALRLCLPGTFQSQGQFIRQPIVARNWLLLREMLLQYMLVFEKIRKMPLVRGGINAVYITPVIPEGTAWFFAGLPPAMTRNLINLIQNKTVMMALRDIRRWLQNLHAMDTKIEIMEELGAPMTHYSPVIDEHADDLQEIEPHALIRHNDTSSTDNADEDERMAEMLILGKQTSDVDFEKIADNVLPRGLHAHSMFATTHGTASNSQTDSFSDVTDEDLADYVINSNN